jgi:hypothetical protein
MSKPEKIKTITTDLQIGNALAVWDLRLNKIVVEGLIIGITEAPRRNPKDTPGIDLVIKLDTGYLIRFRREWNVKET